MKKEIICGIYKITSPSGRIYIGESKNIHYRWSKYKILNCKDQHGLYNSFLKYTVERHSFEIVEECSLQELKCRERYWQDFYNVLKRGLNCKLTECGELKTEVSVETRDKRWESLGKVNANSKAVINTETGEKFDCIKDAAVSLNIKYTTLHGYLKGRYPNKTPVMFF